ncbi:MAG: tRNA uridine-5-carboxymethylaminomethyl(34) synthesis GTPase MnmE [Alphaproteobacteria bacterium]|jgi:tRNA modification GTPase|nr:tRNA uridine-5-carboxymethylaminomethyl(34) synthesis GTPase MnmE [Alphaproteobacteria bacterium]
MDTIFAQATAPGKAGVSIVRVSGPAALDAGRLLGVDLQPTDRRVARLIDFDGSLIDIAFVLAFANGRSFTGDPVVEFHLHGSSAIVARILSRLGEAGFRQAEPGEFTRRALETGQLDMAQVEGLADLIDAETEEQRRQAVRVLDGAIGDLVESWRKRLVRAAALLEATIDFAEEDVPADVFPEVRELLSSVHSELEREAQGTEIRERVREGFEVAIVGPPNIGKSTLLNRLAGREAAITSEHAGTTRDVIEVRMDLRGIPVTMLDTAGLRDADDEVERLGIDLARKRAARADLRIHLVSSDTEAAEPRLEDDIVLIGKADTKRFSGMVGISGLTGLGVDWLVDQVASILEGRLRSAGAATRARHASALRDGSHMIGVVLEKIDQGDIEMVDLLAEDVRSASRSLDTLVGRIDVESLLDEIFSSFCIGK